MADDELQAQLASLGARLQSLEDVEAIKELHRRFTKAVADRRFATLSGYFTDDAVIDGMEAQPLSGAGYVLSSPVVDVTGDTASGEWTWHRFSARGTWEEGRYRCAYRRTADGWRFSRLHFRVVLPEPDDSSTGGGH
jgi:ketosteroid isomerase-like protein